MSETTVVNMRTGAPYDIRIDRRTRWGNPFVIGKHGTRDEVILAYDHQLYWDIETGAISSADLAALSGKRLGCWCAPKPCHGDVLARRADAAAEGLRQARP